MILSACQETARVANAIPDEVSGSINNAKGLTLMHRAKNNELTAEERAFGFEFIHSPAYKAHLECMNELNLAIYETSKRRPAELSAALKEKDEEKLFEVLGYSKEDAQRFNEKREKASKDLFKIFSKYPQIVKLIFQEKDRMPVQCTTCNSDKGTLANPDDFVAQMASKKLEEILVSVPENNMMSKGGASTQGCGWTEPWNAAGFGICAAICFLIGMTCAFGAPVALASLAAGTPWVIPILIAVLGVEVIGGVFETCLTVGTTCIKKVECFWCGTNC